MIERIRVTQRYAGGMMNKSERKTKLDFHTYAKKYMQGKQIKHTHITCAGHTPTFFKRRFTPFFKIMDFMILLQNRSIECFFNFPLRKLA
jgi:hypothetical protein